MRYVILVIQHTFAAGIALFGGCALLEWMGIASPTVDLAAWWWPPVIYGLYQSAKVLSADLRDRGSFPEFFAFWGPYRTAAFLYGILGLLIAGVVLKFTRVASEPVDVQVVVVALFVPSFAFSGLTQQADKRREHPLLAAPNVVVNGVLVGLGVGIVCRFLWFHLTHESMAVADAWHWFGSFAAAGAIGNLWRRFGAASGFGTVSALADTAVQSKAIVQGAYFAALGALVIWGTWKLPLRFLEDDVKLAILFIGSGIGAYFLLARGLGPIVNVLGGSRISPDTHGKARVATEKELRAAKLIPHRTGIYLGSLLSGARTGQSSDRVEYPGDVHLITVGRTGSGKGTGLIIPNLSTLKRSILIIDPKGEAAAITARKRAQFGSVVVLNPFNVVVEKCPWLKSTGFNPLSTVRVTRDNFLDDCTIIAQSLVKQEKGANGRFFSGSAHDLVTALVMHELITKEEDATLANVRRMLTDEFRVDTASGLPTGLAKTIFDMSLSEFEPLRDKATRFKQDSRSNQDVFRTAINETSFIDSPPIARDLASQNEFEFSSMKEEITTVYLILPATHLESHSNWLRLIIASALRELLSTPPSASLPPVLFMLDEFAQLGHLPALSNAMNIARGYGIQLWPFVQDLTQLKDIYGDRWENFVSASSALTAFAPRDVFTADYLSRLAGNKTIVVETESDRSNFGGTGRSRGPQGAPLFRPEELRAMPQGQMLCFVEPVKQPFMVSAPGYWDTTFNDGLDENPYRPA